MATKKKCVNRVKCKGLNTKGQLKKGYKFDRAGRVIKVKK